MARYRQDFVYGVASGVIASSAQTTITGTNWPTTIPSGSYMPVVLNPGYYGANGSPEIVYITSATSTVATVARNQEGTSPTSTPSGGVTPWIAGPLITDFGLSNQLINGEFPVPTASGQFFVSSVSGTSQVPYWSTTIPVGAVQYYWDTNAGATTYVANPTDINNIVQISGNCVIQLPNTATINYGQQVTFIQMASGTVTFSGGATIYSTGSLNGGANPQLRAQYSAATAIWIGNQTGSTNAWVVTGDII
jgi:hypothetical protein